MHNSVMRLDHVSYVASHDQISDVVNRIGSQIGTAFVDGGIHPKFGTRNFTAPLLNGQYIEVVCPIEHPSTDLTPFGRAVKKKAEEGGGWLTWVFSTEDIDNIEIKFKRRSVLGIRARPDGTELQWKQIGVKDIGGTGIRLGGSYTHAELDYVATNPTSGNSAAGKAKSKAYLLNAYYDFKTGTALTPFVGFGAGMYDTTDAKDNEFIYALHGGAKYNVSNNVYVGAKGSFYRASGITDATSNQNYSDHNQYSINATLGYEF
jgi:hypothetical protein